MTDRSKYEVSSQKQTVWLVLAESAPLLLPIVLFFLFIFAMIVLVFLEGDTKSLKARLAAAEEVSQRNLSDAILLREHLRDLKSESNSCRNIVESLLIYCSDRPLSSEMRRRIEQQISDATAGPIPSASTSSVVRPR